MCFLFVTVNICYQVSFSADDTWIFVLFLLFSVILRVWLSSHKFLLHDRQYSLAKG